MENSGWIQFEDQQILPLGGEGRKSILSTNDQFLAVQRNPSRTEPLYTIT
jgi:hypothetical protein